MARVRGISAPGPSGVRMGASLTTSFQQYLEGRGYDLDRGSAAFLRRMFLECWAQPGFHSFWRVWNPAYGYLLFRLYRSLGGSRSQVPLTLLVFGLCGYLAHDFPVSLFLGRPLLVCTVAFVVWGTLVSLARHLERPLAFARWPPPLHVLLNIALVGCGLLAGVVFQVQVIS